MPRHAHVISIQNTPVNKDLLVTLPVLTDMSGRGSTFERVAALSGLAASAPIGGSGFFETSVGLPDLPSTVVTTVVLVDAVQPIRLTGMQY